jgi:hypothetical protein
VGDEAARATNEKVCGRAHSIAPWDWRHRDKRTVILGALSVPVAAQAKLLAPASSADAPSPECIIKGNVNRQGERIYHLPGQGAYAAINIDAHKRWFCFGGRCAGGWLASSEALRPGLTR